MHNYMYLLFFKLHSSDVGIVLNNPVTVGLQFLVELLLVPMKTVQWVFQPCEPHKPLSVHLYCIGVDPENVKDRYLKTKRLKQNYPYAEIPLEVAPTLYYSYCSTVDLACST